MKQVIARALYFQVVSHTLNNQEAVSNHCPTMEVAGLILGVVGTLPVIVKVVEGYQIMIEITHVKRHMATLAQDIGTEIIILRNTYEGLLHGIVPAWELDRLQNLDPSDADWQKYDDKIRSRLRESYHDFRSRVKAIAEAVEDLKAKLAVTPNGEVRTNQSGYP